MNGTAAIPRTPAARSAQPSRLRRVGVGRVVVWEIAALAVLATTVPRTSWATPTIVVALIATAATAIRLNGRYPYQWAVIAAGYLARRARTPAPAPTPLVALLPKLRLHTHIDRAGNRVGLVRTDDDTAYSAVIRIAPSALPDPNTLISLLHRAFTATDIRLAGAQLAVWSVPGPPAGPIRVHWLSVRYRASDDPAAALARGGGHEGARKATAAAALRLARDLTEAGQPGTVLDTLDLHQELLMALGAHPDGGPARVDETWRTWSTNQLPQTCYTPARATAHVPPGWYAPGTAFTCTTYTLTRTASGDPRTTTAARAATPPHNPALKDAATTLGLVPTSGRTTAHVRTTLPLAL